jgi:hypothetical protein
MGRCCSLLPFTAPFGESGARGVRLLLTQSHISYIYSQQCDTNSMSGEIVPARGRGRLF